MNQRFRRRLLLAAALPAILSILVGCARKSSVEAAAPPADNPQVKTGTQQQKPPMSKHD